jgi:hypothetical protein
MPLGLAALLLPLAFRGSSAPAPAATTAPAAPAVLGAVHCQVPCGVYGDRMRIDMTMEDCATIEKGMAQIGTLSDQPNQMVRWVLTKDQHAAAIQERVASYWLAQRIKAPAEGDAAARAKYLEQLELQHGITVAAMKCKQTTDAANVAEIRELSLAFSETYFSAEDLAHIKEHHSSEHK